VVTPTNRTEQADIRIKYSVSSCAAVDVTIEKCPLSCGKGHVVHLEPGYEYGEFYVTEMSTKPSRVQRDVVVPCPEGKGDFTMTVTCDASVRALKVIDVRNT